ncbi:MAG: VOC family protein [Planctomycetes bacterium]|nr:VOC family protein [Planctomycetota bacterium]
MTDATPRATIRFLFNVCNDVEAMRRFYVDDLGLKQDSFQDTPEFGWLSLQCEGFQAMWFRADNPQPIARMWAMQPGWQGGTAEVVSWGIWVPEAEFAAVFERLAKSGAPLFRAVPEWRQNGYWGLSVRDPMGATIEVYTTPKTRPETTIWPTSGWAGS